MLGKKEWYIPDGFMNPTACGDFESHEAICVLNMGAEDAHLDIAIYFEDRGPMEGFTAVCPAKRTNHVRLDKITSVSGEKVPHGVPYAIYVKSDLPVVVQHSRMDVSQPAMTLMTTIAYSE